MSSSADEVASLFNATLQPGGNAGEDVYPGYPGWVVENGRMRTMTWGFPLALKGKSGQPLKPKPVNNTRTDKLTTPFWRSSLERGRCLVPMTAFAEAEGPKGGKTRTWISVPNQPAFACAGIWRDSEEWGPVYSAVMTEACVAMDGIHDRMPVLLKPREYARWLSASSAEAFELCRPYTGELTIERTDQPWVAQR